MKLLCLLALVACTHPSAAPAGDDDPGGLPDPACTPALLAEPHVASTFYVAIGEPGADNVACDGRAPTDEGGGHCPFKDLHVVASLPTASVRIEVRAGTYPIDAWEGLVVEGTGQTESESLVLSAYGDERPVIDVAMQDLESCLGSTPPPAGCVRQVLRVKGTHVVVQGLTIRNGLAYDAELSGSDHLVRCNKLHYTRPFSMRSDGMKLHSANTEIRYNEFATWHSQAIDMAGSTGGGIVIEDNDFHDPSDHGCGATGIKLGAHGITVRHNQIHDIVSPHCTSPRALVGGGGTEASDAQIEYSATDIVVTGNRISHTNALVASFASCADCAFTDNDIVDAPAGVMLAEYVTGNAGCAASATGCKPTTGMQLAGNRIRTSDVFVGVDGSEGAGLAAANNLYCGDDKQFAWAGVLVSFTDWLAASGTDATSQLVNLSDARCSF